MKSLNTDNVNYSQGSNDQFIKGLGRQLALFDKLNDASKRKKRVKQSTQDLAVPDFMPIGRLLNNASYDTDANENSLIYVDTAAGNKNQAGERKSQNYQKASPYTRNNIAPSIKSRISSDGQQGSLRSPEYHRKSKKCSVFEFALGRKPKKTSIFESELNVSSGNKKYGSISGMMDKCSPSKNLGSSSVDSVRFTRQKNLGLRSMDHSAEVIHEKNLEKIPRAKRKSHFKNTASCDDIRSIEDSINNSPDQKFTVHPQNIEISCLPQPQSFDIASNYRDKYSQIDVKPNPGFNDSANQDSFNGIFTKIFDQKAMSLETNLGLTSRPVDKNSNTNPRNFFRDDINSFFEKSPNDCHATKDMKLHLAEFFLMKTKKSFFENLSNGTFLELAEVAKREHARFRNITIF